MVISGRVRVERYRRLRSVGLLLSCSLSVWALISIGVRTGLHSCMPVEFKKGINSLGKVVFIDNNTPST